MEIPEDLRRRLKRLRLSGMLGTLPDRAAYAAKTRMPHAEFLGLVLADEIERRDQNGAVMRAVQAGLEAEAVFETFDWEAKVVFDRERVKGLLSLAWLERAENVVFAGPVGVGKTHLAQALGHAAARSGKSVLFIRADRFFKRLRQARGDNSVEKEMRRFLGVDLLILDDLGLRKLDAEESSDLYETLVERHRRASTIVTSNRDLSEWVGLFSDAILANSALDRFAHGAHQIFFEGESYRAKKAPGRKGGKR